MPSTTMPRGKHNEKSWLDAALDMVSRFGRRLRDEWNEGQADALKAEPEPAPKSHPPGKRRRGHAPPPWWEVLQVPRTATRDEIRRAYRRLIKRHHPDKTANLPPEKQLLVERNAKLLNDAYERAIDQLHTE